MKISPAVNFEQDFRSDLWLDAARDICRKHNVPFRQLERAEYGEHVVFLVDSDLVIQIYKPLNSGFEREKAALRFVEHKIALPAPEILFEGVTEKFNYLVTTRHVGVLMTREAWLGLRKNEQIQIITELAHGLKELHSHDPQQTRSGRLHARRAGKKYLVICK